MDGTDSRLRTMQSGSSNARSSKSRMNGFQRMSLSETRPFNTAYTFGPNEANPRRSLYDDRLSSAEIPIALAESSADAARGRVASSSAGIRPIRRARAVKNLVVLGCGCMLWLTAFTSLQNLQSTLNPHRGGIGITSLGAMYAAMLVSCFLAPSVIAVLGTKWTIVAAYSLFLVVVAANFHPRDYLLVPASLLFGCVAGPLWTAQSTYLTTLSVRYAQSIGELPDSTVNRFNGVFAGLMQTSQVWGSVISAVLLSADNDTVHLVRRNRSCDTHAYCGARDCTPDDFEDDNDNVPHHAAPLPAAARTWLLSAEAVCCIVSVVLPVVLLDADNGRGRDDDAPPPPPPPDGENPGEDDGDWDGVSGGGGGGKATGFVGAGLHTRELLLSTFGMMRDSRLDGLAPLVLFVGLQQGFIITDFTKSFINCALGIHQIGFVMLAFGAVNSVTSVAIGHVAKHIRRIYIVTSGALFNAGTLLVLASWGPSRDDEPMFFVVAACLGLCDAIWQTQLNTMFGMLFTDSQESAFSCFRIFQTTGLIASFVCSQTICVHSKVYAMSACLVVALVLYGAVEYSLHRLIRIRDGDMIIVL